MSWTLLKILEWTTDYFARHGIPTPRLDAEVLLGHALSLSRVQLYIQFERPMEEDELQRFRALVKRRAAREPVAYLTGTKAFWSLDFEVGPGVLIPRPDTETLVERALELLGAKKKRPPIKRHLPWREDGNGDVSARGDSHDEDMSLDASSEKGGEGGRSQGSSSAPIQNEANAEGAPRGVPNAADPPLVLDLCTGSGIIAICIARDAGARVVATDISQAALAYARRNVAAHVPANQVALLHGDLTRPVPPRFRGRFDLVTSNPPYLSKRDMDTFAPEIVQHEPAIALFAEDEGRALYKRIAREAPAMLRPGGHILLEVSGLEQAKEVIDLLEAAGFDECATHQDLARIPRVVEGRLPRAS